MPPMTLKQRRLGLVLTPVILGRLREVDNHRGFKANLGYIRVLGQPDLQSENLSKNNKIGMLHSPYALGSLQILCI